MKLHLTLEPDLPLKTVSKCKIYFSKLNVSWLEMPMMSILDYLDDELMIYWGLKQLMCYLGSYGDGWMIGGGDDDDHCPD